MSEAASCSGCGRTDRPLNDYRRCKECQELFANLDADVAAGEVTLETLVEQITAATGSDEVVDALAAARSPVEKLERQRWREALLRAMRGKAQSPAKIVDAWLGSAAAEHGVVLKQSGELVKLVLSHGAVLFHTPVTGRRTWRSSSTGTGR